MDDGELFDHLVRVETALWNRTEEALRAHHGVSLAQYEVMGLLDVLPVPRVGEIAGALGITVGGASKVVDRVESAGHCRRSPHPEDRRSRLLALTPAGRSLLGRARRTVAAELDKQLTPLGAEQRERLGRALALLREILGATRGVGLMRAAWYDRRGPAEQVLEVGELPDLQPGPGEVRIALSVSAVAPGDVKKRQGWQGAPMAFPRVVPHSDGAGVIDAVGDHVEATRVGQPVWCYGAQSYRPFGTAAQQVLVPSALAVALPTADGDLAEQAACLGISGITAHRAVFAGGPVEGLTVLVHGAAGGVGSIATQLARRGGALVIAVVRDDQQAERALALGAHHAFAGDVDAAAIASVAPAGVDRIAEVDLAAHADLDAQVLAVGGQVASYFSHDDRPAIPYWGFGFKDATLRLLGSDDFPAAVKAAAASDLTAALVDGALRSAIAERLPLADIARAHALVEGGAAGRVLLRL